MNKIIRSYREIKAVELASKNHLYHVTYYDLPTLASVSDEDGNVQKGDLLLTKTAVMDAAAHIFVGGWGTDNKVWQLSQKLQNQIKKTMIKYEVINNNEEQNNEEQKMKKIRADNMKVFRNIWDAFMDVRFDEGAAIWTNRQWRDLDRSMENLRFSNGDSIAYQETHAWFEQDEVRKELRKVEEEGQIKGDEQWDDICYSINVLQSTFEIDTKDLYAKV